MILRRLSSEVRHCSRVHADHFNNDRTYSSKGLSFYICLICECTFCIYVAFATEGHMVE